VPTMPALGTYVAVNDDEGSRSVTYSNSGIV
jgi:hypothetical protein